MADSKAPPTAVSMVLRSVDHSDYPMAVQMVHCLADWMGCCSVGCLATSSAVPKDALLVGYLVPRRAAPSESYSAASTARYLVDYSAATSAALMDASSVDYLVS